MVGAWLEPEGGVDDGLGAGVGVEVGVDCAAGATGEFGCGAGPVGVLQPTATRATSASERNDEDILVVNSRDRI